MYSGDGKAKRREFMFGCVQSSQLAANVQDDPQRQHNKQVLRRIRIGNTTCKYGLVHKESTAFGLVLGHKTDQKEKTNRKFLQNGVGEQ